MPRRNPRASSAQGAHPCGEPVAKLLECDLSAQHTQTQEDELHSVRIDLEIEPDRARMSLHQEGYDELRSPAERARAARARA
jgi:hypothetical protein